MGEREVKAFKKKKRKDRNKTKVETREGRGNSRRGLSHYPVFNFYQINKDGEIRTRDHFVIKTLISC